MLDVRRHFWWQLTLAIFYELLIALFAFWASVDDVSIKKVVGARERWHVY